MKKNIKYDFQLANTKWNLYSNQGSIMSGEEVSRDLSQPFISSLLCVFLPLVYFHF